MPRPLRAARLFRALWRLRTVMGIYDRDYYRREGPSFLGNLVEKGTICKWLIGINVACFLLQMATFQTLTQISSNGEEYTTQFSWFTEWFSVSSASVFHGQVWRLLTYAFLHSPGSFTHIFFNMLFLWWFGHEIEDLLGAREFLCFYLLSALLGGVFFVITNVTTGANCIGASGAVTAIMVLFAFHFPRRTILVFWVLPVPIWALVAFEVAQDLFLFTTGKAGVTAVGVHLAGAAFAFAYYKLQWRLTGLLPDLRRWQRRQRNTRLRVYHPEEPQSPAPVSVPIPANATQTFEEEQLEARMDAVLEKISRVGKENLTESERQLLMRASEVFRRRRP